MYALTRKNGHVIWKERWYAFTSRISSQANFYMTQEDQVFVADVVVIGLMREIVTLNLNIRPIGATAKLRTIAKIHKYRRFHEGHHFILMAMEVHRALEHDMNHFIKECECLFLDK
jgi:hypothetical protein